MPTIKVRPVGAWICFLSIFRIVSVIRIMSVIRVMSGIVWVVLRIWVSAVRTMSAFRVMSTIAVIPIHGIIWVIIVWIIIRIILILIICRPIIGIIDVLRNSSPMIAGIFVFTPRATDMSRRSVMAPSGRPIRTHHIRCGRRSRSFGFVTDGIFPDLSARTCATFPGRSTTSLFRTWLRGRRQVPGRVLVYHLFIHSYQSIYSYIRITQPFIHINQSFFSFYQIHYSFIIFVKLYTNLFITHIKRLNGIHVKSLTIQKAFQKKI
jgi:hypothetical protein